MVPGNHDINREEKRYVSRRMNVHRKEFLYHFYVEKWGVPPDKLELYHLKNCKTYEYNGKYKEKEQCIFPFHEDGVAFIPLYSQHTLADEIPKKLSKHLKLKDKEEKDKWLFDRGLIEKSQLNEVAEKLKEYNYDDLLKIAVFHHNPLPIPRGDVGHIKYPDLNILGNGPEVIEDLKKIKSKWYCMVIGPSHIC